MAKKPHTDLDVDFNPLDASNILGKGFQSVVFKGSYCGQPAAIKRVLKTETLLATREEYALRQFRHPSHTSFAWRWWKWRIQVNLNNQFSAIRVIHITLFQLKQSIALANMLDCFRCITGCSLWNCVLGRSNGTAKVNMWDRFLQMKRPCIKWPVDFTTSTSINSSIEILNRKMSSFRFHQEKILRCS